MSLLKNFTRMLYVTYHNPLFQRNDMTDPFQPVDVSRQAVEAKVYSILRSQNKLSRPYCNRMFDGSMDWASMTKDAIENASAQDRDPGNDTFALYNRKMDSRVARVRKTVMFHPNTEDASWLDEMKTTIATCQFGDPYPNQVPKEMWNKRLKKK